MRSQRRATWTTLLRQLDFLRAYRTWGVVDRAARAAHVTRQLVYHWRAHDEAFAREMRQAWDDYRDRILYEMHRRAVEGVDEPVYRRGRQVGLRRRYSDRLMEALLSHHCPDVFRKPSRPLPHLNPVPRPPHEVIMPLDQLTAKDLARLQHTYGTTKR
jgi:hypothetical protein